MARCALQAVNTSQAISSSDRGASKADVVGGSGPDFSATVTGQISQAEGSFDSVTGVTSNGAYSLQLNTAPFSTSACNGSTTCQGWEQFVYESSGVGFMQYWLLSLGPAGTQCPVPRHANCQAGLSYSDGWCPFQFSSTGPVYCVVNAANEAPAPATAMTSLGQLRVAGAAGTGGAHDSITVSVAGTPYGATGSNYFPDLANQWKEAEFNVFGDGNAGQAVFNSGATLVVRTEVTSGTRDGPGCDLRTFTGESTNLTLVNSAPSGPSPAPGPALVFSETNPAPAGPLATCKDAASLGDTHLTTFAGLLYDFQAAGDFVLVSTSRDFQVQTRQVSGAPTWPNATVNKAVGVKSRSNRVAICLPERVIIDGRPVQLADGDQHKLADGGSVMRKGNVYVVLAPSGDSLRATLNPAYIDVSVGLGRWPDSKLGGLLANVPGKINSLSARDGEVITSPFPFDKLYGHYAASWRVPAKDSALSLCGEGVRAVVPTKPFFASDLSAQIAKRNQAVCMEAGVRDKTYLDACMIDVAMIGPQAASIFVGRVPPVAVGDARKR